MSLIDTMFKFQILSQLSGRNSTSTMGSRFFGRQAQPPQYGPPDPYQGMAPDFNRYGGAYGGYDWDQWEDPHGYGHSDSFSGFNVSKYLPLLFLSRRSNNSGNTLILGNSPGNTLYNIPGAYQGGNIPIFGGGFGNGTCGMPTVPTCFQPPTACYPPPPPVYPPGTCPPPNYPPVNPPIYPPVNPPVNPPVQPPIVIGVPPIQPPPVNPPPDVCIQNAYDGRKIQIWGDPHVTITQGTGSNNTDFHTLGWQSALTYDYNPNNGNVGSGDAFALNVKNTAWNNNASVAVVTEAQLNIAGAYINLNANGTVIVNGFTMAGNSAQINTPIGPVIITKDASGKITITDPIGTMVQTELLGTYMNMDITNIKAKSKLGGFAGDAVENYGNVNVNGNYGVASAASLGVVEDSCVTTPPPNIIPDGPTQNVINDACTLDQANGLNNNPMCTPPFVIGVPPINPPQPPDVCTLNPFANTTSLIWGDPHVTITEAGNANNTDFHAPGWQSALTYDYNPNNGIIGGNEAFALNVFNTPINANGVAVVTAASLTIAGSNLQVDVNGNMTLNGVTVTGNRTIQTPQGAYTISVAAGNVITVTDPLGTQIKFTPAGGSLNTEVSRIGARSGLGGFLGDALENQGNVNVNGNYAVGSATSLCAIDDNCATPPPPIVPDGTTTQVIHDACMYDANNGITGNPLCPPIPVGLPPVNPPIAVGLPAIPPTVYVKSYGDTHVVTALGMKFDNTLEGNLVALKNTLADLAPNLYTDAEKQQYPHVGKLTWLTYEKANPLFPDLMYTNSNTGQMLPNTSIYKQRLIFGDENDINNRIVVTVTETGNPMIKLRGSNTAVEMVSGQNYEVGPGEFINWNGEAVSHNGDIYVDSSNVLNVSTRWFTGVLTRSDWGSGPDHTGMFNNVAVTSNSKVGYLMDPYVTDGVDCSQPDPFGFRDGVCEADEIADNIDDRYLLPEGAVNWTS